MSSRRVAGQGRAAGDGAAGGRADASADGPGAKEGAVARGGDDVAKEAAGLGAQAKRASMAGRQRMRRMAGKVCQGKVKR